MIMKIFISYVVVHLTRNLSNICAIYNILQCTSTLIPITGQYISRAGEVFERSFVSITIETLFGKQIFSALGRITLVKQESPFWNKLDELERVKRAAPNICSI